MELFPGLDAARRMLSRQYKYTSEINYMACGQWNNTLDEEQQMQMFVQLVKKRLGSHTKVGSNSFDVSKILLGFLIYKILRKG